MYSAPESENVKVTEGAAMRKKIICLLVFLLFVLFCFGSCKDHTDQNGETTDADVSSDMNITTARSADPVPAGDFELIDGVYVTKIFSYSGAYFEDGSNDACEGVCAVCLYNASPVHYQYLRFTLKTTDGEFTFSATTLFAGSSVTVLSENKEAYKSDLLLSSQSLSAAPFSETPSVHLDSLQITYTDGFINVKNLTDQKLENVYVYYKNTDENGYLGGITYRTSFGELEAGEVRQGSAQNMHKDSCKVVFATYGS